MITIPEDLKKWFAISCPTSGIRFDARTLELLDSNHDGHIRTDELLAALDFLKQRGVELAALENPDPKDEARLVEVMGKVSDLEKLPPTAEEQAAQSAWEAEGRKPEVAVLGDQTAAAEAALKAVEGLVDTYFVPEENAPLVTEGEDRKLPLASNINVKYIDAIDAFRALCVRPILGSDPDLITFREWMRIKAAFAAFRKWQASKPVRSAAAKATLEEEERLLRYKLHLGEFLINYVTMDRLYGGEGPAIFQTGLLRIDGREMSLCFHVASEAAHAPLAEKSKCCVIYLKLMRPAVGAERNVCAVVTAGTVGGLYVGRNGVFYDRDGCNWEAVVTRVVESQVSLLEAFWAPWRKIGEAIANATKKFLGDRQAKAVTSVTSLPDKAPAPTAQPNGAALASSVAAIGIGIGMVGAALASLMAVLSSMTWLQICIAVAAIIPAVSVPSMILAWFKLRKRDLAAILNASGWAVNRKMRFSMARARKFTRCAR